MKMAGLTPTSSRDVQLDNAKGVYTMHIDSRNLDSNSLLGKALKNIDADGDGEIEQVSLNNLVVPTDKTPTAPPPPLSSDPNPSPSPPPPPPREPIGTGCQPTSHLQSNFSS